MKAHWEYVLGYLRNGEVLCSQGFFHEDSGREGITHRLPADIHKIKKKNHIIDTTDCPHGRDGAKHYELVVQGQGALI